MNLSFQEKSTWISLFSLLIAYSYYFYRVFATPVSESETFTLFILAVVVIVIIQIVLHIVVAIFNARDAQQGSDERDKLFELRATRIASVVLASGALLSASLWLTDATPLNMANAILLSLVVAQLVQCLVQLFYYRRDV